MRISDWSSDVCSSDLPQISVDLEEKMSYDIADAIRNDIADIGIVADSVDLQGLETHVFRPDPLVLIVAKDDDLVKHKSISLAALADYDFVGLMEGSALQDHIAHHARRSGKQLSYRIRLRSIDAVCRMVGQGVGIAVVPKAAAVRCAKSAGIKHIALTDAWASRELLLCLRSSDELPVYVRQMMTFILTAK